MRTNALCLLCLVPVLSSCVSNTVHVRPDPQEYQQLAASPVYIKKAADTDLDTYEIELDECIKSSNTKVDRSSKVGIGLGSYFLVVRGLYTIVTASGVLAPIALAAGTAGGILGGSTIFATMATEEFREYRSLEKCLEYKGHDVVFYDAKKSKEKKVTN